jgi:hypothetical protein
MLFVGNFESRSPVLPKIEIPFYRESLPADVTTALANFVIRKESDILKIPAVEDANWLTDRLGEYNLLDYSDECPELNIFNNFIYEQYVKYISVFNHPVEKVYVLCWANIVRSGGRTITEHHHANGHSDAPQQYSYISGNFCAQVNNTATYFKNPFLDDYVIIPNNNGELVLFPSWVNHWATDNESEIPRVTISFDIIPETVYQMISDKRNYKLLELC